MNRYSVFLILFLAVLISAPNSGNARVTINIGDPGFYGRLDIGGYPSPRLIYSEPVIARPIRTWYPPIYLRVPPSHVKQWYRHCDSYGACGRPVYFVEDAWYQDVYVPRYRKHHRVQPPPRVIHKPRYYEYRKYDRRPPKKVYIEDRRHHHPRPHDRGYRRPR